MRHQTKLNFDSSLVDLIRSGEKFLTWRINDDKNIQTGDELIFCMKDKDNKVQQSFGFAKVIEVWKKRFKDFSEKEKSGHEKFASDEEMIEQYKKYYGSWVSKDTLVKIIRFELIK